MKLPLTGCAYFLDIDGTLVDFADAPARVRLNPALPGLVETLHQSSGGAVALITGRSLDSIDRLFPLRRLPAAGQHGLERRTAQGQVTRHQGPVRALDGARRVLKGVVDRHSGLLVEDKELSIALHYRRSPALASYAHRVMRLLRVALGDQYCLQQGKRVVELAPAGRDKGAAIASFMLEPPFAGRTPLFIGDDVTDEYGFAMVNQLGGYAIKVGPGRTKAGWRLPDVAAVLAWLTSGTPVPQRTARPRKR